ncbi:MAG: hypothetical protein WD690_01145 [Vicinamibacterales bacterium]
MSRCLLLLIFLLVPALPVMAQTFETAGARALGMGGAFVAVADDVSAVWWNPAGLASGGFFGVAVEWHRFEQRRATFFGAPAPAERASFFLGVGSLPLGLSYVRTRETYRTNGPLDEPIVRDLVTHQAGITVLQSLTDTIVLGGTIKYVRGVAGSGPLGDPIDYAGSNALDADLAVMAVSGPVKAGLTFRNVLSPEFEAPDGTRLELPWLARAGVAYLASAKLTLAFDVDLKAVDVAGDRRRAVAIGGEYRLTRFAVRAGARFDSIGPVNPLATVGGSYAVRNGMWIDAWAAGGARDAERGWGIAGRVVY